ncbi:MAG: hypothetical protein J3K34DRAFT_104695 [Monoraphidium minutum]|nr:MAG: hypothetical protein J3K34DRAFT_104695 [Monoraphidium minutum]
MEELERGRSSKGFRWFFCCGGTNFGPREPGQHKPKAPRRHARGSGGARRGARRPSSPSKASLRGDPCHVSILSEDESWHDVQDAFSVGDDGSHSPLPSIPGSPRGSTSLEGRGDEPGGGGGGGGGASAGPGSLLQRSLGGSTSRGGGGGGSVDGEELSCSSEAAPEAASGSGVGGGGLGARLVGSCLSGLRQGEAVTGEVAVVVSPKSAAALGGPRPPIGCTMRRRRPDEDPAGCERCWDVSDPTSFHIRSLDYMRTKVKEHSGGAIYRLAAVDVFTTEAKAFHVARLFSLPAARGPVLAGDAALPPILIFNILLPAYTGGFFGPTDGPGQCLVYTFVLPDDFDAATFPNKPALGLLGRFVSNGREADGGSTRDRLKLIARVSNPEEWAARAPLSGAELKLLTTYNEKPLLTRPQVRRSVQRRPATGGGSGAPAGSRPDAPPAQHRHPV